MLANLPSWSARSRDAATGRVDLHYWYFGTMAMQHFPNEYWLPWSTRMLRDLPLAQHRDPARDKCGSWDPVGPWGRVGGRIYSTALTAQSLEVFYGRRHSVFRR
jgi:hypothetical protein